MKDYRNNLGMKKNLKQLLQLNATKKATKKKDLVAPFRCFSTYSKPWVRRATSAATLPWPAAHPGASPSGPTAT